MQEVFWQLGSKILNLTHKGAIFDASVKLHESNSENDNLDILH